MFFEVSGKLTLIRISHLFRYFSDGPFCIGEQPGCFVHTDFPQPSRYILPIYASEIILQASFTDREAFRNLPYRDVLAKII